MNKLLRIFVEGGTDVKFLKDLIWSEFTMSLPDETYIKLGSWTYLFSERSITEFHKTKDKGGLSLVIIDADDDYEKRYKWIIENTIKHRLLFSFFLLPDHHSLGNRESLLQAITNPDKYKPFAKCFNAYVDCITAYNDIYLKTNNKELVIPDGKVSIHNYLAVHAQTTREHDRDYKDSVYWNLEHPELESLKKFFRPYLDG